MNRASLIVCALLSVLTAGCSGGSARRSDAKRVSARVYDRLAERLGDAKSELGRNKIAVLPFACIKDGDCFDGEVVAEALLTRLTERREFEVVERALLNRVLAELKLQGSGGFDEASIKNIGRLLGVEAIVSGTLTRRRDGGLEVNARLVKVESAMILAAARETLTPDWERPDTQPVKKQVDALLTPPAPAPRLRPELSRQTEVGGGPVPGCEAPRGQLLARWNFDEGRDPVLMDSSGRGNNGDWHGRGRHYAPAKQTGFSGAFNGTDDYVSVPSRYMNPGAGGYSVAFWAHPFRYLTQWAIFVSKATPDLKGQIYYIHQTVDGRVYVLFKDGDSGVYDDFYSSAKLPLNAWTHVAVTRDPERERIYINGRLDTERRTSVKIISNTDPLLIGARLDNPNLYYDGLLDDMVIYGCALTDEDVNGLWNCGSGTSGRATDYGQENH
jgi:TolB-like protein